MSDPTPITLAEGEALYRAGDLPDKDWEATDDDGTGWVPPSRWPITAIVVARRTQWTPKPGDRVTVRHEFISEALAVHGQWVWVLHPSGEPCTYHVDALSPEQAS